MSHTFDAVIVGAGVAGIATAYYLSTEHNMRNILLVDKRAPMTFTSDKSGSNYRNWWPAPAMVRLANRSITLMDSIAAQHGNFFNMNRRGYAYISGERDIAGWLARYEDEGIGAIRTHTAEYSNYPNNAPAGSDVLLGNDYIREHMPFVSENMQSVVHVRRAGWLSTRVLFHHMLDAATQRGLADVRGEVTGLKSTAPGITEVTIETAHGLMHAETSHLILAAGPFVQQCADMLGFDLPLYNVLHQKIMLRDVNGVIPDGMPFMIFRDSPSAVWTANERAFLRSHSGSETLPGNFHIRAANDDWIIAGWAFNRQQSEAADDPALDAMFAKVVLKGLSGFIPDLADYVVAPPLPILNSGGYYTRTVDNMPIIGSTPRDGVYMIGGLSGFGVMVACGAGALLAEGIASGEIAPDFALERYAAGVAVMGESGEL
ncbi:MAG: FAD-binding oxidoreductase [Chloroflexota bacterium]